MAITTQDINKARMGIKSFLFESHPNDYFHLLRVAKMAREILEKEGGDSHLIFDCKKIISIIEKHDEYNWTEKDADKSVELKIVQDADNLDALGAMGISRVFSFGGTHTVPIYIAEENLKFTEDFAESAGTKKSSIAHFYEKFLKLEDNVEC